MSEYKPLLIHFGPRRNSINSHVQHFAWPDNIEQSINALEYCYHHLIFILRRWLVFRMRARMDNTIHVQVQIIEFNAIRIWKQSIFWYPAAIFSFGL